MNKEKDKINLYYDGKCFFCKKYSKLIDLRKKVDIKIINARLESKKMQNFKKLGYNINKGIILECNSKIYSEDNAIRYINKLITPKNRKIEKLLFNILNNKFILKPIYQFIKLIRKLILIKEKKI